MWCSGCPRAAAEHPCVPRPRPRRPHRGHALQRHAPQLRPVRGHLPGAGGQQILYLFIVLKISPPASLTTSPCRRGAWRVRRRGWSGARPRGGPSCGCGRGCWPPSAWATPAATPGSSATTAACAPGTQPRRLLPGSTRRLPGVARRLPVVARRLLVLVDTAEHYW